MKNSNIMMKQNGEYDPKKLGEAYNDVNEAIKTIMKNNPDMDFMAANEEFNKMAEGEAIQ